MAFYNLFNFANFDLPGNTLNGLLTGAPGQINGTTRTGHNVDRVGVGTGVYSLGAPPTGRVRAAAHLLAPRFAGYLRAGRSSAFSWRLLLRHYLTLERLESLNISLALLFGG